jgi:lanthionine synthetase-like protein
VLFDPAAHERLTDTPWSAERARAAIAAIAADAEGAFDPVALWSAHPRDEAEGPLPAVTSLYLGASGVIWALDELARAGAVELRRSWREIAAGLHERYVASPDFPEDTGGEAIPSLWMGEAGILLVAHRLAPAPWQEERLLQCVLANAGHPSRELMWGSPGTMLAACVMHERTGDERWALAWGASAQRLLEAWHDDVWRQDMYGASVHYLGPAHGFAGNVAVLARGSDLLDGAQRAELEERAVAVALRHARHEGDLAQWPPTLEPPSPGSTARTQWCHGAPGMVASVATLAPRDGRLTEVLVAGGELTWRAGPLAKGAGLCHGTAGNGYAFLKLFERTADERWLERARAFAMHAAEQVDRLRAEHGRGRHTLWTGDPGTALYLQACLDATSAVPTLDTD